MSSAQSSQRSLESDSAVDMAMLDSASDPQPAIFDSGSSQQAREWEESFIEEVRKYHCLWDISSSDYKDR